MNRTSQGMNRRHFVLGASVALAVTAWRNSTAFAQDQTSLAAKASSAEQDVSRAGSLRAHAASAGLLVGFAVNAGSIRTDAAYRSVVQQQCNIIVTDNAMKWRALRPSPDTFHFEEADPVVAFANSNGIKMRGHNLCWYMSLPEWFTAFASKTNARDLLVTHIRTVAGRYAGRMHSWDVVNEAIDPKDGRADGLRKSPWLDLVGPDYVDIAFRAARQADPKALLTYNEYGFEEETDDSAAKRAATLQLLRGMRQRNVPLDAVGIQSHVRAGRTYGPGLAQFIDECRRLDLRVYVTELDMNDRDLPADIATRDAGVASAYRSYLAPIVQAANVDAVLTWGVSDAQSWLNGIKQKRADGLPERALLLDETMAPAPAFFAVRDTFDARRKG